MASPVRTLTVNFVGKTDSLEKAFKRVNKGSALMSDKMRRNMRMGIGAIGGLGAAVGGFVALTKPMVDAASDIGESLSKNEVLFGASADQVASWAETTSRSFGISRREALEAVGVFGALTHAMGMSDAEGSDMSVTMVNLAADMASFNNASPEETLVALQAGLRGEAEPLRRYGVLLDAATLKQRALSEGIITNTTKALTPQQKALAAYSEILAQTEVQQGDFERTSDGLANKQRVLSAVWGDLQADLGEKLLPAFQAVTTYLVDEFMPAVETMFAMTGEEFGEAFAEKVIEALGPGSSIHDPETFEPLRDALLGIGAGLGAGLGKALWEGFIETLDPSVMDPTGVKSGLATLGGWIEDRIGDLFGRDAAPKQIGVGMAGFLATDVVAAIDAAMDIVEETLGPMPGLTQGEIDDMIENEVIREAARSGPDLPSGLFPGPMGDRRGEAEARRKTEGPPGTKPPTPLEEFHEAFKHLTDRQLEDFFGMAAGPSTRGEGLPGAIDPATRGGMVGTIVINTTAVTGEQVVTALHDAVENQGLTLPPRWSGSLGR